MENEKTAILSVCLGTLRSIAEDTSAPPAARAAAARTLLEALGVVGAKASRGASLSEGQDRPAAAMSDAELSAAIARLAGGK
jgi:hypothetical protein